MYYYLFLVLIIFLYLYNQQKCDSYLREYIEYFDWNPFAYM